MIRYFITFIVVLVAMIIMLFYIPIKLNMTCFSQLKDLYALMSSIGGIFFSVLGLLLGYFYYLAKLRDDKNKELYNKYVSNIKQLIDEIKDVHENIELLFNTDQVDTSQKRIKNNIINKIININILLETKNNLLHFDLKNFISFNSYADRIREIDFCNQTLLKKKETSEMHEIYYNNYRNVLKFLYVSI